MGLGIWTGCIWLDVWAIGGLLCVCSSGPSGSVEGSEFLTRWVAVGCLVEGVLLHRIGRSGGWVT